MAGALIIPYSMRCIGRILTAYLGTFARGPYTRGLQCQCHICSAPMGLSLGALSIRPTRRGTNSFNSYGGWEDHVTITGSGNVQLGISQSVLARVFFAITASQIPDNTLLSKAIDHHKRDGFCFVPNKLNDTDTKGAHDLNDPWEGGQ